ncbi:peptidylprolyl isomerase [Aquibacillus albus]|uniref:peptidylprolyl isomerase n=1 Tax=Aquibacillus albus TaxID=1168171 RepID=A0ABS2N4V9_9BACI|nr:peptidyl-prolyl cis-trans isomerase [Aquibacillus albus]MBM7573175.1 foldase protein PrsA [Aquibacillus albus]
MTRKFLFGVIISLLITNLTTIGVWMVERNQDLSENFSVQVNKNEAVATINNKEIFYDDWIGALEGNFGEQVLKDLINKEVVFQLAKEQGIDINQKLIDRELSLLFTMAGVLTHDEIEPQIEKWEQRLLYRLYMEELLTQDISVDEGAIRKYYENHGGQYEFDESIQLSHIIVNDRETAIQITDELNAGASFAALAREYSIDENTKSDGGYLGFYTETTEFLPSDYFSKAIELEEHTYSEPFVTSNGIAILYLHRRLPSISFSYEELKPHMKRELALEEIETVISADLLWDKVDVDWIYGNY